MPRKPSFDYPAEAVELGGLLANTVGAIVEAQERMDAYTLRRQRELDEAEGDAAALPPLWFVFDKVALEVELSASVRAQAELSPTVAPGARAQPRLFCQTLNPTAVSLYGYEASAGLKIRLQLGPRAVPPPKDFGAAQ